MKVNQKHVQLTGDALIPFFGFFLWEWNLYFILLFYVLDMASTEILLHLKSNKIVKNQDGETRASWFKFGAISFFFFFLAIVIIHLSMLFIDVGIDFKTEALAFWNYKEMGMKQGVFLVPLVFLVGFMQYRMEFVLPRAFKTEKVEFIWKKHVSSLLVIIALGGLCLAISRFVVLPEFVYVLLIIFTTSIYKTRFN
jgi:hypothetical protein